MKVSSDAKDQSLPITSRLANKTDFKPPSSKGEKNTRIQSDRATDVRIKEIRDKIIQAKSLPEFCSTWKQLSNCEGVESSDERRCLRHAYLTGISKNWWMDLSSMKNRFIFKIKSKGSLSADIIFAEAIKALYVKRETGEHASCYSSESHDISGKDFENFMTHLSQENMYRRSLQRLWLLLQSFGTVCILNSIWKVVATLVISPSMPLV